MLNLQNGMLYRNKGICCLGSVFGGTMAVYSVTAKNSLDGEEGHVAIASSCELNGFLHYISL